MSSDVIAIQTAEAAGRPWVQTLHEWVTTIDHKRLGVLYILYALFFLVIGGIEATIIRIQLMRPHNDFVSPQVFNRMFTMHGTTMIFFVAMPILFGFANYLVPLMIGARDMAFPRLNAFSFWLTAFGGLRQHRHRHQHHRHYHFHAVSRHDAEPHAAAGMDELGDVWNGFARDFASIRSSNHVARGSLSWRSFFRYAGRRFSHFVDALLLDIWASRGVCPDHSLFCVCL